MKQFFLFKKAKRRDFDRKHNKKHWTVLKHKKAKNKKKNLWRGNFMRKRGNNNKILHLEYVLKNFFPSMYWYWFSKKFFFFCLFCFGFIDLKFNLGQVFNIWLGIKSFMTYNPLITISDTFPLIRNWKVSHFIFVRLNVHMKKYFFSCSFMICFWESRIFANGVDELRMIFATFSLNYSDKKNLYLEKK